MENGKEFKNTGKLSDILLAPWITEAATALMERNQYVFRVRKDAGKNQIKNAVETLYQVKVLSVNTVTIPSKKVSFGRRTGKKSAFKKAVVKIKEGHKIDFFEGK